MRGVRSCLLLAATVLAGLAAAAPAGAQAPALPAMRVFAAPTPLPATDDRRHLVYEIIVVNDDALPRHPRPPGGAQRERPATARRLLRRRDRRADARCRGAPTRTLGRGDLGLILFDVTLAPGRGAPERLVHRVGLTLRRTGAPTRRRVVLRARTRVSRQAPVRVSPPLRGVDILALGCCGRPFAHRPALVERAGRPVIAQRYAIDFVRVNTENVQFAGDPAVNANHFIYGDEILAAAPGRIVATRDGVPENTPPVRPPNPPRTTSPATSSPRTSAAAAHALYAHLQPGSLRVRPGDVVQTGQVLGLVGNSGNSPAPHLHFHVMNGAGGSSRLEAEGVPYTFDRLAILARFTGLDVVPPAPVRRWSRRRSS